MNYSTLTILLINKCVMFRDLCAQYLRNCDENFEVAEAASADEADWPQLLAGELALILLGPSQNQLTATEIQHLQSMAPDVPIMVISHIEDPRVVLETLQNGASGFVPTSLKSALLVHAVRIVTEGGKFVPACALGGGEASDMGLSRHDLPDNGLEALTPRQKDVLSLLLEGQPNKLIANELEMRESTVKVHVRQIMKKLNATNRTQAVVAVQQMLLQGNTSRQMPAPDVNRLIRAVEA